MTGFTAATILFSAIAFVVFAGLALAGQPFCALPLAIVLGLAVGYVGAYLQKDDPSKTARIARNGAKAGIIAGVAGFVGRIVAGLLSVSAAMSISDACLGGAVVVVFLLFGWLGGWSWARQEHERQTGYKPT